MTCNEKYDELLDLEPLIFDLRIAEDGRFTTGTGSHNCNRETKHKGQHRCECGVIWLKKTKGG